jgi:hypothetical protein
VAQLRSRSDRTKADRRVREAGCLFAQLRHAFLFSAMSAAYFLRCLPFVGDKNAFASAISVTLVFSERGGAHRRFN